MGGDERERGRLFCYNNYNACLDIIHGYVLDYKLSKSLLIIKVFVLHQKLRGLIDDRQVIPAGGSSTSSIIIIVVLSFDLLIVPPLSYWPYW